LGKGRGVGRNIVLTIGAATVAVLALAALMAGTWQGWSLGRASGEPVSRSERPLPPPPYVRAEAAALFDATTGRLLVAHNAFRRLPPATLTKVLTALTALQIDDPDAAVRIGAQGPFRSGLSHDLFEGERLTLLDLLRLALYRPGTDAALAVATHVSGSEEAFARQMNAVARRVGAEMSHFVDAHGYHAEGNLSTAFDLGLIALAAMRDERLAAVVGATQTKLTRRGQSRRLFNVNSFIGRRADATGVKTSYTPDTGYALMGSVERGDARLLVVVLASPSAEERFNDATGLVDYGLAYLEPLSARPAVPMETYEVREGDTLTGLANRFRVPIAAIKQFNSIGDPNALRSGERLLIPR